MTAPPTMGTEPGDLTPDQQAKIDAQEITAKHRPEIEAKVREITARIDRPSGGHAVSPSGYRCYDCQQAYRADLLVPDHVWAQISPMPMDGYKTGGLLCPTCIMHRIVDRGIWQVGAAFQDERVASLERDRDEARATLKYCDGCWSDERGTMIDKIQSLRILRDEYQARAITAETQVVQLEHRVLDLEQDLVDSRRGPIDYPPDYPGGFDGPTGAE